MIIFTLDIETQNYPIITLVEGLPHDSFSLVSCGTALGGIVVITSNSIIYVDQSSRRVALPLNGWAPRISDVPTPALLPEDQSRDVALEGCRALFVDERTIFLILRNGTVYPVEIVVDGKTVSRLKMAPALAQTTIPSIVKTLGEGLLFIGSTVGPSVLLRAAHVVEEIEEGHADTAPTAVVHDDAMDYDDDDGRSTYILLSRLCLTSHLDIYGGSKSTPGPSPNGVHDARGAAKKTKTVIHLSLRDSLPAYGPIASMAFSLARNGVSLRISCASILLHSHFTSRIVQYLNW